MGKVLPGCCRVGTWSRSLQSSNVCLLSVSTEWQPPLASSISLPFSFLKLFPKLSFFLVWKAFCQDWSGTFNFLRQYCVLWGFLDALRLGCPEAACLERLEKGKEFHSIQQTLSEHLLRATNSDWYQRQDLWASSVVCQTIIHPGLSQRVGSTRERAIPSVPGPGGLYTEERGYELYFERNCSRNLLLGNKLSSP